MQIKTASEAFSLFSRWKDNGTPLRVSFRTVSFFVDVEGVLDRVEAPIIGLRLVDCGFIEFLFDNKWIYEFATTDAVRTPSKSKLGKSSLDSKVYRFGEAVSAVRTDASKRTIVFYEIVKRVG